MSKMSMKALNSGRNVASEDVVKTLRSWVGAMRKCIGIYGPATTGTTYDQYARGSVQATEIAMELLIDLMGKVHGIAIDDESAPAPAAEANGDGTAGDVEADIEGSVDLAELFAS